MIPERPEFIAWDKGKGKWIKPEFCGEICVGGDIVVIVDYKPDGRGGYRPKSVRQLTWLEMENIDTYQFIGRLDKNGNKVYEGSKVRPEGAYKDYVLEYDTGRCAYILKVILSKNPTREERLSGFNTLLFSEEATCEVTGHIAEDK